MVVLLDTRVSNTVLLTRIYNMYSITVSNGQSIQQAINSIPTEDQPVAWTIRLEPGIYNEDVVIDRRVVIVGDGYNTSIRSIRTDSDYLVVISNVSVINTNTVLTVEDTNNVTLSNVWLVSQSSDIPIIVLGEQSVVNFDNCSFSLISTNANNNAIIDIQYGCRVQFTSCNVDINLRDSNHTTLIKSSVGSVNLGVFNSYFKLSYGNDPVIFNLHNTTMLMVNTVIDYSVNVGYVQTVLDVSNSMLYILTSAILHKSGYSIDSLVRDYNLGEDNTRLYIYNSVVNGVYRVIVRYNEDTEEDVDIAEDPYVLYSFILNGHIVTNGILNMGPHMTYIKHISDGNDYITTRYDHTLLVDKPNTTIYLTVGSYGQELVIKNISTGNIVIRGDIYGITSQLTLSTARVLRLQSDGYYWYKL